MPAAPDEVVDRGISRRFTDNTAGIATAPSVVVSPAAAQPDQPPAGTPLVVQADRTLRHWRGVWAMIRPGAGYTGKTPDILHHA